MACHVYVHALLVATLFVIYRAYDRKLVRMFRDQRDVFAKMNARGGGLDMLKLATKFRRSLRLRVKRLEVAHAAPRVNNDAGLRRTPARSRSRLSLEKSRERQAS